MSIFRIEHEKSSKQSVAWSIQKLDLTSISCTSILKVYAECRKSGLKKFNLYYFWEWNKFYRPNIFLGKRLFCTYAVIILSKSWMLKTNINVKKWQLCGPNNLVKSKPNQIQMDTVVKVDGLIVKSVVCVKLYMLEEIHVHG